MDFSAISGLSTYSAKSMRAAVCGRPSTLGADSQSYKDGNKCDVNGIANPDNIWYDNKYNSLFIAEDTSSHQNDIMWQFNPATGSLVRALSSPYGAGTNCF
jgi:secreted PhoX family phosphatase